MNHKAKSVARGQRRRLIDPDEENQRFVQLRIRWATNVPKVDTFSESDPYLRVLPGNGVDPMQTKAIQDEPNPWWDEDFYFDCLEVDGQLEGEIRLELWDDNQNGGTLSKSGDVLIGHSILDLSSYSQDEWADIELPVTLEPKWQKMLDDARRPKRGWFGFGSKALSEEEMETNEAKLNPPTLVVSVIGSVPSLNSLLKQLSDSNDIIVDPQTQSLRVPFNDPSLGETTFYLGLGFSNANGLILIISNPIQDSPYFIDLIVSRLAYGGQEGKAGGGSIRVERMRWPKGRKVAPRVKIFEEIRLLGLPLNVDLMDITFDLAPKLPADCQYSVSSLLEWGGWGGPGVTFSKSVKQMTTNGAMASAKKQEIYLPPDHEWPPVCLLGLDWKSSEDSPDGICPAIVMYEVHNKGSSTLNWEFCLQASSISALEYAIECFSKPIKLSMGDVKLKCRRKLHLYDPGGPMRCDETVGGLLLVGFGVDGTKTVTFWFLKALLGQESRIKNEDAQADSQSIAPSISALGKGIGNVASKGLGLIGSAGTKIGSGVTEGFSTIKSGVKSVFAGNLLSRGRKEGGDSHGSSSQPSTAGIAGKLHSTLSIGNSPSGRKKRVEEQVFHEEEDY